MRPSPREASLRRIGVTAVAVASLATGCATSRSRGPAVEAARRAEETAERPPVTVVETPPPPPRAEPPVEPVDSAPPDPGSRPLAELTGRRGAAPEQVLAVIDDLRFAPGSAALDRAARARLAALSRRLDSFPGDVRLEIQGHTDSTGDAIANLRVALQRAEAVRLDLLDRTALAPSRLSVVALGASHPLADDATPAGRARNRRVTVLVLR